jgi:choline/glycine/proline betaine transport protein
MDSLTAGGKLDAPVTQRVFWAVTEGGVAAVLLIGGGLTALQTASIITGLPFTILLFVMMYSLHKGLSQEYDKLQKYHRKQERKSYQEIIGEIINKNEKK